MISHSLGAMPARAADDLAEFSRLWVEKSINAWDTWLPEVERAGNRIARIIGAPAGSVMMLPNVSHGQAVVASCFDYTGGRNKVVYTDMNFPSVSYLWQEEQRRGAKVEVVESPDGIGVPLDRLLAAIDEHTLIVPISHVLFRSSRARARSRSTSPRWAST
jgi:kynureninase